MASYRKQLENLGFGYDTLTANGYNKINGVCVTFRLNPNTKDHIISAACRPFDENAVTPMRDALQQFAAERQKIIKTAAFDGKKIMIIWHINDIAPDITKCVNESVSFIRFCIDRFGCVPCCSSCGNESNANIYAIENNIAALCSDCFTNIQNSMAGNMYNEAKIITNYPMGILGAVLGGLAGAVIWILFSMMGKISIIAGLFAAVFGYFGFKKLGKKMTLQGLILSLVVSFIFLLGGMYVAIGIDIFNAFKEWGVTFSDAFELIPYYLTDPESIGEIIYNHILGILTFILGTVCCIVQFHNDKKVKNRMVKLM